MRDAILRFLNFGDNGDGVNKIWPKIMLVYSTFTMRIIVPINLLRYQKTHGIILSKSVKR